MIVPLPPNEDLRLDVLRRYSILDTRPEERFDRLARMAARIFCTPIALISLVDEDRLWFKACFGLDACEIDRKLAFCSYTILSEGAMVVENALADSRFSGNPLVQPDVGIRFYAGAPLRTKENVTLGSICVLDFEPRQFSAEERASLEDLAAIVVDELELRERNSLMAAEIAHRQHVEAELLRAREELKNTNEELKESEQRLNALLDNAPVMIYSKDLEGRHVFTNRPFRELINKSKEEIVGKTDFDLFSPELAKTFKRNDTDIVSLGSAMEFEESVPVNGVPHVFRSVKFPLRNEQGQVYAVCGMSMDITARKKAEIALREIGARKAAILDASLDGIITINHRGRILEVNAAIERIFGYPAEQMLGQDMAEMILPERIREAHREGLQRISSGGEYSTHGKLQELPAVRADGTEFSVELAITQIPLDGKPMFTGYIRDITARKQAQAALEESQARYERMAANLPGMVFQFVLHPDGNARFNFVSEGARELLKGDPAPLLARTEEWDEKIFPADLPSLKESLLASASKLKPWNWEGRLVRSTGEIAWAKVMSRPKHEANGDIVWDGFIFDITELKESEEALRKSRDEAERANRAKSEFLSRMSHELRTPLNAILGFGQLLERAKLEGRQAESVAQITKAGRHLLELINEVLDLARIEAGRMSFSPEPVNATELICQAADLIRPLCEEGRIKILSLVKREYWVTADRQRLHQVLLNLLSNAVKYNKPGGTVVVRCLEEDSKRVSISVTDTGFGIPAAKLDNLFIPFERLGAEQRAIEGSGIGLALSKRLLDIMGGSLHVESEEGNGSTFTLELPACEPPYGLTKDSLELFSDDKAPESRVRNPVLYVEDNPANLRLMERILEERDDIVLYSCERGDDALNLISEIQPRLVMLDLHLPGLDGEQVLQHLRGHPEFKELPVVIISADAMSSKVGHLLAAGASEYLTKPIDVVEVLRVLDKYLNQPTGSLS